MPIRLVIIRKSVMPIRLFTKRRFWYKLSLKIANGIGG